jgi:hypothetical protein
VGLVGAKFNDSKTSLVFFICSCSLERDAEVSGMNPRDPGGLPACEGAELRQQFHFRFEVGFPRFCSLKYKQF